MNEAHESSRVVIVTGGSRGIGLEICRDFAAAGDTVVVASRDVEACARVAASLKDEFGVEALGVGCHVGRWADCDDLVDQVLGHFGRIDVLVNNAGMSPLFPSLGEVTEALFDKVLAVNLRGAFRIGTRVGESMVAAGGGSIVNVSSVTSIQAGPTELPYAMAKAGVNTLTVGLARAFAPHVRVNTVMPGPIRTEISESWPAELWERLSSTDVLPMGRIGEISEVVGAVRYLTSEGSTFTTGSTIRVDGGLVWAP